ncbi:ATP-binding protein [Acidocella aminolytica]|uniref:ATP-binding protein n=1 Tax=Acidocella aminolytica TaxID=33998 RepID=UPI00278C5AFC|nr:ATP-binding protein [Acidocella aminolytica]
MATVIGYNKMTTALLDRPAHHCYILETANGRLRFKNSSVSSLKKGEKPAVYPL